MRFFFTLLLKANFVLLTWNLVSAFKGQTMNRLNNKIVFLLGYVFGVSQYKC